MTMLPFQASTLLDQRRPVREKAVFPQVRVSLRGREERETLQVDGVRAELDSICMCNSWGAVVYFFVVGWGIMRVRAQAV